MMAVKVRVRVVILRCVQNDMTAGRWLVEKDKQAWNLQERLYAAMD
jgi:hypothetical protein